MVLSVQDVYEKHEMQNSALETGGVRFSGNGTGEPSAATREHQANAGKGVVQAALASELLARPPEQTGLSPQEENDFSSPPNKGFAAAAIKFPEPSSLDEFILAGHGQLVEWTLESLLPKRAIVLLSGQPKDGKSTWVIRLLAAISHNHQYFCGLRLRPGKVLIAATQEAAHLWGDRKEQHDLDPKVIHVQMGPNGHLRPFQGKARWSDWEAFARHIAEQVRKHGYGLVVIDTLSDFWPVADENDAAQVTRAVNILRQIADAGATVLLVSHNRKAEGTNGLAVRGSNALAGFADVLIELRRESSDPRNKRRILRVNGRYPCPPETVVELTEDGYMAVGDRVVVREAESALNYETAIRLLPQTPPGLTLAEILAIWPEETKKKGKPSESSLRAYLKRALGEGRVLCSGGGVRNDVRRYYLPLYKSAAE